MLLVMYAADVLFRVYYYFYGLKSCQNLKILKIEGAFRKEILKYAFENLKMLKKNLYFGEKPMASYSYEEHLFLINLSLSNAW